MNLNICSFNSRSIRNKIQNLDAFIENSNTKFDIICITETWLAPEDHFHVQEFNCIRFDRNFGTGGGALILIKHSLAFERIILDFQFRYIECVTTKIVFKSFELCLCNVYNPPLCTDAQFLEIRALFSRIFQYQLPTIIVGDWNLPNVCWTTFSGESAYFQRDIVSMFAEYGLYQRVLDPTHVKGNILDLVLVNENFLACDINLLPPLTTTCDHYMITFCVPLALKSNELKSKHLPLTANPEYDFRLTNFEELKIYLRNINWDILRNFLLIYSADLFEALIVDVLHVGFEMYTPQRKIGKTAKNFSFDTKLCQDERNCAFKKLRHAKRTRNLELITLLSHKVKELGSKLQRLIRKDILLYEKKVLNSQNPKRFFSYANSKFVVKKI